MPPCLSYTDNGHLCLRPATQINAQGGYYVCALHNPSRVRAAPAPLPCYAGLGASGAARLCALRAHASGLADVTRA